ncbi:ABC transporter [Spiribacter salinus M19-40]|uniref:ABC transporter n=1 Tax=Spiribacter salinus M19-40 TaxID=1260251 RepID=R4VIN9_9GAMM|nr:ABC transporter ATP-binding protein [Spiribacter salinus]AGM40462.1 ABC transporter [Spiribacter salinus M19-40]MDR9413336.1 ABC transporter ATP-binding protein [Spiribacter sp.]MDR9454409.1 ABC transporter ATP-binding protein [Spiribacter sp.]
MADIAFDSLTRWYGESPRRQVLNGVSGHIRGGEFVVVVGRSGSGKSTLLNLLGGLDLPSQGTVRVDGTDIATLKDAELTALRRARMGFVFQAYNLIPTLSVADNLRLPLSLNGLAEGDRIDKWLERVGLSDRADAWPDTLSGGEQQRVAIARALIHDPAFIFADEPTGNLDLENAERIVGLLDGLCREAGRTLIMVTHAHEVVGLADQLLTIRDGRLVEADAGTSTGATP